MHIRSNDFPAIEKDLPFLEETRVKLEQNVQEKREHIDEFISLPHIAVLVIELRAVDQLERRVEYCD